ncbi:hypothetical protein F5Y05DRAFT_7146 [Hypoxylon sp. FL0543]|nr:hypothetical protein F5Y05DRAFT_7146 [Hypoxylon sp. FL0543]
MARPKRMRWTDVYDPVVGHHRPQEEVDGQLPERNTVTESAEQDEVRRYLTPKKSSGQLRLKIVVEAAKEPYEYGTVYANEGEVTRSKEDWIDEEIASIQAALQNGGQPLGSLRIPPTATQVTDQEKREGPKHEMKLGAIAFDQQGTAEKVLPLQQQSDGQKSSQSSAVNSDADYGYVSKDSSRPPASGVDQKGKRKETAVVPAEFTRINQQDKSNDSVGQHPHLERDFGHEHPVVSWTEGCSATRLDGENYCEQSSNWGTLNSASNGVTSTYVEEYVMHWVLTVDEVVADIFPNGVKEPEACDIHPERGILLEPIQYPPTKRVVEVVRGLNDTSQIRINRKMREIAEEEERKARNLEASKKAKELQEAQKRGRAGSRQIRIPNHLRPARLEDMEQVAALYNMEVKASYKLPDKLPVSTYTFVGIHAACVTQNLPFFVAIDGWYDKKKKTQRVVGFIVVDILAKGICGSYQTQATSCGKLTVLVHPDFRRKNICSAMLDAVFFCCSMNYSARLGYEIVNPEKDLRHMIPKHNPRKWHSLDIEVVVPSGSSKEDTQRSDEFKWISNYLTSYFQMQLVCHDEKLLRDDRLDSSSPWLDRLTFRHQCRRPWDHDKISSWLSNVWQLP